MTNEAKMRIAVLGCGNMGGGMARHLRSNGWAVVAFDASPTIRAALASDGLRVETAASAAVLDVDLVILSLPTAAIVDSVMNEIAGHLAPGVVVLDTSTSHPAVTKRLAEAAAARGQSFVDGPVSGGPAAAASGGMTMLLGGDAAAIAKIEPVLDALTKTTVHVGPAGAGHAAKIVNNMLCAANLVLVGEAVALAEAVGLDPADVLTGVNAGSGRSAVSEVNFPRWILNGAFDSGFTMGLMRKDVRLAETLLSDSAAAAPAFARIAEIWAASAERLPDDADFNAIATSTPETAA